MLLCKANESLKLTEADRRAERGRRPESAEAKVWYTDISQREGDHL